MVRVWGRVCLGLIFSLCLVSGAVAEKRLALVIGNAAYQRIPKLANTLADARLIIGKLEAVGFQVDPVMDATKATLNRAVRDFARKIEQEGPETVALIYYAGHGVQDSRQANYLLAVDSDARSQIDLPIEAIPLDNILKTIEQANPRITIAIVDACRDDPLPQSASRGGMRGLAAPDVRRGLLIAYSTEPGKSAADGPPGRNSPFATALADAIDEPGLEAAQLFQQVSRTVFEATKGDQFPWVTQRLTEPFHFRPPGASTQDRPNARPNPTPPAPAPQPSQTDLGEIDYGRVVIANTTSAYEDWMRRYSDHPRSTAVKKHLQRLREEELWIRAENLIDPREKIRQYQLYLDAFPDGVYGTKARERIAALTPPSLQPTPYQPPVVTINPTPAPQPQVQFSTVLRYPGKDAPNNDRGAWIRGVSSVDDCERICQQDAGCVGYTINLSRSVCIKKNQIGTLASSRDSALTGILTDRTNVAAISTPSQPRVQYYDGMDIPGRDRGSFLRNVTAQECENICLADRGCAGYTYNKKRSACIPKDSIGPMVRALEPAFSGVVQGRN